MVVTGGKDLKPSEAYLVGFGATVGQLMLSHCNAVGYTKATLKADDDDWYDADVQSNGSDVSYDSDLDWIDDVRNYCGGAASSNS